MTSHPLEYYQVKGENGKSALQHEQNITIGNDLFGMTKCISSHVMTQLH
jgi:hypothetical protein